MTRETPGRSHRIRGDCVEPDRISTGVRDALERATATGHVATVFSASDARPGGNRRTRAVGDL